MPLCEPNSQNGFADLRPGLKETQSSLPHLPNNVAAGCWCRHPHRDGEDNDGLVTMSSPRYGEFQELPWRGGRVAVCRHNLDSFDPLGLRFDHVAA